MSTAPPPSTDPTLSLPRILCLHGGGTTASIFTLQMRPFLTHPILSTRFRFIFVDAPFFCAAGAGVTPVYSSHGPFRRWFRWLASHPAIDADACIYEIEYQIQRAMDADTADAGGTGAWVGVLGFSQGAKLAASMLYAQQLRLRLGLGPGEEEEAAAGEGAVRWRFGVVMAGRAPLVSLGEESEGRAWMQSAAGLPDDEGVDLDSIKESDAEAGARLTVPTVHVHGLADEGLVLHRRLVEDYCEPGSTVLVEWNGNHRIPFKKVDVDKVVDAILAMADAVGV